MSALEERAGAPVGELWVVVIFLGEFVFAGEEPELFWLIRLIGFSLVVGGAEAEFADGVAGAVEESDDA
ncbi:MAG: hypothetical protein F4007_04690, partial [Chloroflexi bacterium]|nr:hypothetical protein [Chloroflexota bacterium]